MFVPNDALPQEMDERRLEALAVAADVFEHPVARRMEPDDVFAVLASARASAAKRWGLWEGSVLR